MNRRFHIKWILMNRVPIPCDDLFTWGRWMARDENIIVAQTALDEEVRVSTIFMGIDHNWSSDYESLPILFETIAFGEERSAKLFGRALSYRETLVQRRYCTWQEAAEGHEQICAEIRAKLESARMIGMQWSENEKRDAKESGGSSNGRPDEGDPAG